MKSKGRVKRGQRHLWPEHASFSLTSFYSRIFFRFFFFTVSITTIFFVQFSNYSHFFHRRLIFRVVRFVLIFIYKVITYSARIGHFWNTSLCKSRWNIVLLIAHAVTSFGDTNFNVMHQMSSRLSMVSSTHRCCHFSPRITAPRGNIWIMQETNAICGSREVSRGCLRAGQITHALALCDLIPARLPQTCNIVSLNTNLLLASSETGRPVPPVRQTHRCHFFFFFYRIQQFEIFS